MSTQVVERLLSGAIRTTYFGQVRSAVDQVKVVERPEVSTTKRIHVRDLLVKLFLPSGYPSSVTPDYLRFQVFNGLQSLCNSVSGLISSRAILEGSGVGDASASATNALLVNVLQEVFSRLTTIIAAFYMGTSLFPEAKTYRIIADIFNDLAIIFDVLSPLLATATLSFCGMSPRFRSLRIIALCLSGSLRSICSIASGGSKAALSTHFAMPITGRGDLGDLTAKESSLETVLCLIGMLAGTLVIPYLTNLWSTYIALFALLVMHILANYIALRGIAFRTLNRQRTMIAWTAYRQSGSISVLSPAQVAAFERILEWPGALRDVCTGRLIGCCSIGSSLSAMLRKSSPGGLLSLFHSEHYVLLFDEQTLRSTRGLFGPPALRLHICLKEGHTTQDLLKAWLHAVEAGMIWNRTTVPEPHDILADEDKATAIIRMAYHAIEENMSTFVDRMCHAGWKTDGRGIMTGVPRTLLISVKNDDLSSETNGDTAMEARKDV